MFTRPTLETLIKRNQADIESTLPGADAKLRRSNLGLIAKIISACTHGLYGYLAFIAEQILPDTAITQYLDRHASLWLSVPRKPASYATGQVIFTGAEGVVIEADTVLIRADGIEYTTLADVTISAGQAIASVESLTAGQITNSAASTSLSLASPIAGINASVTVNSAAISGGADQEQDDALRARVKSRIQSPPHGGALHDYKAWALEVAGVTRAWVYPNELGLGTVVVRFVRDNDASLIPDSGEVATVQAYIEPLRPVTAQLTVVAPVPVAIDFSIALTPATLAAKAAVEAELKDLLLREAEPGGTILISHIREAISIAAGETNYNMTTPSADITRTTGQISVMGAITWL